MCIENLCHTKYENVIAKDLLIYPGNERYLLKLYIFIYYCVDIDVVGFNGNIKLWFNIIATVSSGKSLAVEAQTVQKKVAFKTLDWDIAVKW